MLRRTFLKACAAVACCLSSLLPDLMPGREKMRAVRSTSWQVRITDPTTGAERVIALPPFAIPLHGHAIALSQRGRLAIHTEPRTA